MAQPADIFAGGFDVGAQADPDQISTEPQQVAPEVVSAKDITLGEPVSDGTADQVTDPTAVLMQLPVLTHPEFQNIQQTYSMNFANPSPQGGDVRSNVVQYAKSFVGTPYVWGGASPGGFDCSGLVQYATSKYGLHLPRVSSAQAGAGKNVGKDLSRLMPGDLIVMEGGDHIAIYAGNGQIVEAPHTGAQVRVRGLGKNEAWWGVHLNYPGENQGAHASSTGTDMSLTTAPQQRPVLTDSLAGDAAKNAQAIVRVGRQMGASTRDIQIALMTAWTESGMQTSAVGDGGDAIGLFQQHASWGTYSQRTNPAASARAFYKILLNNRNRNSMTPWQAAQAVQRSAFADGSNYAANWNQGQAFYKQYGG